MSIRGATRRLRQWLCRKHREPMTLLHGQYGLLDESLQVLAADADDQLAYLPDFVVATDDVADDFREAFLLLPQLEDGGMVERSAGDVIRQVDRLLDSRPTERDGSLAYYAARLRNDDFWFRARVAAKEALFALNEEVVAPRR